MKKSWPVLGVALALLVSLGAGCAEGDDFFGSGAGGKRASSDPNAKPTPSASPSGDLTGGIR